MMAKAKKKATDFPSLDRISLLLVCSLVNIFGLLGAKGRLNWRRLEAKSGICWCASFSSVFLLLVGSQLLSDPPMPLCKGRTRFKNLEKTCF
jgi:hypothetical protein